MRDNILSIDFTKSEMQTIFAPYQVFTISYLVDNRKAISRDVWIEHNDLFEDIKSRASFINFLNYLENALDIVHSIIETSKGGYRKKYTIHDKFITDYDVFHYIVDKITKKLRDELKKMKVDV